MEGFFNKNGDAVSVVPTRVIGTVADATTADVDFGFDCYILPSADGSMAVEDNKGTEVTIQVFSGIFFPAMLRKVLDTSDAIGYSYWT